jgi:hypothetical protein
MTYIEQLGILAERGILITKNSRSIFELSGFYKSGTVKVNVDEGTIVARYDEEYSICNNDLVQTLVDINYDWWQRSKDRSADWKNPDVMWLDLLQEYGLVTRSDRVITEYK